MTTDADQVGNSESPEQQAKDRKEAYKEAAISVGKGIALGLVPFLAQAVDAYDTVESVLVLNKAKTPEAKEEAQFDLVLALVGWIPGPGDGVKRTLRLVNANPKRFAPVMFDLLAFVLQECGIQSDPLTLLEAVFDAGRLRSQMDEVKKAVADSSPYQALPESVQQAIMATLATAALALPAMLEIVQKRLRKWKALQANSVAQAPTQGRAKHPMPGTSDGTSSRGGSRSLHGQTNTVINATLATEPLPDPSNEIVGISGEHIADYMCAYSPAFGWGRDWSRHDSGGEGHWTEGTPSRTKPGKLSAGGKPKQPHVLYKLSDGANGTGIDAVWRADRNNGGKPYAIVEAKASRNEDARKFNRHLPPGVAGTLGVVVKGEVPITDLVQVIEPIEDDDGDKAAKKSPQSSSRSGRQKGANGKGSGAAPSPSQKPKRVTEVIVQMSHEWIEANIDRAVSQPAVLSDFKRLLKAAYSRHLFYSPRYHPSGSPDTHFTAKQNDEPDNSHTVHDAFHYDEHAVKAAVNKRKAALRKKYGNLQSLKEEK